MAKRIAIVHDYIKEYGGAERVLEALHEMYPDAPVYTLVYAPQFLGPHKERFESWNIRPSWLQHVPFSYKFISIYRLIAPWVFKSFDFSGYDVVIVSATGAYSPNMIRVKGKRHSGVSAIESSENSRGSLESDDSRVMTYRSLRSLQDDIERTFHICYCHTPPRYLYGYATAREPSKNPWVKLGVLVMCHILRMVDYVSAQNVDVFIANSQEVARRIEKFYRRSSTVIYPPVDISSKYKNEDTNYKLHSTYYLCGGRLARPKHIELIIKAFIELKLPLKIFGRGFAGYEEELKNVILSRAKNPIKHKVDPSTSLRFAQDDKLVEFLGEVSDEEKFELMRNAKAYVFASKDEDFGILPVEAMGVGAPVIAYKSGGVLETVIDGKTGLFFNELSVESLKDAIKKFETFPQAQGKKMSGDCTNQAQKFSKKNFIKKIREIVNDV